MNGMASRDRDPDQPPPGVDPDAWRIVCAAPPARPDQLERLSAIVARYDAGRSDTKAG